MDVERALHIAEMMDHEGYAALICRLPQNMVLLTGYQPILGNSFCVATLTSARGVEFRLAVPADEASLVPNGVAADVRVYAEETMERISTTIPSVREPLAELLRGAGLGAGALVGYEGGQSPVASYYTQLGVPGPATLDLLRELLPRARFRDATGDLDGLAAVKTTEELAWIRHAEDVARIGFGATREEIQIGATEADVAAACYSAMLRAGYTLPAARQVTPHVHVMAGPRSAEAYKAFNLTSDYAIERGDTVSVQLEVALNGYWAELTRPFFADVIGDEWRAAHAACMAAQDAVLAVIRDGVTGRDADTAARAVLRQEGFGDAFKNGLGHGFGFQAINHAAAPILHPASQQVLRAGMVHNLEPAVYLDGRGGIRLNDNVLVTRDGNELLSARIPRDLEWLVVKVRE
jgi:Xaa-Pro dipeptidase